MTSRFSPAARRAALVSASHVRVWTIVVASVLVIGTAGYVALGGWSFADALYMTVITLTTVGFREVRELHGATQAWTMLVALSGVGIIFGSVGIVAEYVVTETTSGAREQRRMEKALRELRGHFVLCGYGRVGSTVAQQLREAGETVVVVDVLEGSLVQARAAGHHVVAGDATDDAPLLKAGVDRARGLVATADSDATNVYVILTARALNPGLLVVARANAVGAEAKLRQAGADRVVSPYVMAGRRIAELAVRPRIVDFLDAALSHGELAFRMEDVEVSAGSPLESKSVGDLRDRGVYPLAIFRPDGAYDAHPPPERRIQAGESLILSGSAKMLAEVLEARETPV